VVFGGWDRSVPSVSDPRNRHGEIPPGTSRRRVYILDEGEPADPIPVVCPGCRDVVSVDGHLDDVSPGDPISAFCPSCERAIEVAAPVGIEALDQRPDEVAPARTEFAASAPRA